MRQSLIAILAALSIATGIAYAQPDDDDFPRRGPMHERLNLTDAQESQMQKIRLDLQRKQMPLKAKIAALRLDVKEQYMSDKPDRKAIERALKNITDTQLEMKSNMTDHWFAVNNILTPDQQKVWKQMAGRFIDGAGRGLREHQGWGPGFGPGPRGGARMHWR